MNANVIANYVKKGETTTSTDLNNRIWLRMEQEDIPDDYDEVSLADISGMMANVINGESAKAFIADRCPYVTIIDSTIIIDLNFYVWPNSQNLEYELIADVGTIVGKSPISQRRTFDSVFEGSSSEFINYNFNRPNFTPEMPIFDPYGNPLSFSATRDMIINNGYAYVKSGQKIYSVFLVDGFALGYEHILRMEFEKYNLEQGIISITDLKNNVIASWKNESGELDTFTLPIEIPGCVDTLLSTCDDGTLQGDRMTLNDGNKKLLVYYNGCGDDDILAERWRE